MLRFIAIGLALLAIEAQAQDKTANAVEIRQLQCDAVSASSAPPLVASDSSSESKDFQAAILTDTTINGPARANAAAGTSADDDSESSTLSTGQTPSSGTGGAGRDQSRPAGTTAGHCEHTLTVDDGDKSKDVKILQVSPQDHRP